MARVKCLTMQRDEVLLLEPWLRYYGYLFGYENLVVIDNGSTLPSVLETLRRYERAGVSVLRDFPEIAAFQNKGRLIAGIVRHLDTRLDQEPYDFALPVDCDEFLAVLTTEGLSCSRRAVHACFDALIGRKHAFGIELSFYNLPGRPGWFFPDGNRKGFLAADTVLDIDHGFHLPRSRVDDRVIEVPMAYLHYHNRPYAMMLGQARRKLKGLVDTQDEAALRAYEGPGFHLVPYFFMSETDYARRYDKALVAGVPEFTTLLEALGLDPARLDNARTAAPLLPETLSLREPATADEDERIQPFDGRAYLSRYEDVRTTGMPPLYHYLLHGRREGRRYEPG